ncbi:MAG: hypothetical protein SFY56_09865 [Bacteroidota bacterium]|nr:hypothetical protein [Bacteroidota bacterium]
MKKTIIILVTLYSQIIFCQEIISSKTYINTCYQGQQCFSFSNGSYLFFNRGNNEFDIVLDFGKFKIGSDTLDRWLEDLDDTKLFFKGYLNTANLLELTHHNSKAITVNGKITFNNITISHSIELTLFEIAGNGILYRDNGHDYFDRVNANLQFAFLPKEFKINKKANHLKKSISIAVYRGYVNEFKPGMESWLQIKN